VPGMEMGLPSMPAVMMAIALVPVRTPKYPSMEGPL